MPRVNLLPSRTRRANRFAWRQVLAAVAAVALLGALVFGIWRVKAEVARHSDYVSALESQAAALEPVVAERERFERRSDQAAAQLRALEGRGNAAALAGRWADVREEMPHEVLLQEVHYQEAAITVIGTVPRLNVVSRWLDTGEPAGTAGDFPRLESVDETPDGYRFVVVFAPVDGGPGTTDGEGDSP